MSNYVDLSPFFAYRAESYGDELNEYFSQPKYFPRLTGKQCCLLVGARGSGKTTVLRGLKNAVQSDSTAGPKMLQSVYYKINSKITGSINMVVVDETLRFRVFCHYLNLELTFAILNELRSNISVQNDRVACEASPASLKRIAGSIGLDTDETSSIDSLIDDIEGLTFKVQNALNNDLATSDKIIYSALGGPVKYAVALSRELLSHGSGDYVTLAIDEFESLAEWQQIIFNTLIKECLPDHYTFKIGVRRFGYLSRLTITKQEVSTPSDLSEIDIAAETDDEDFMDLALKICNKRLMMAAKQGLITNTLDVKDVFEGLSSDQEAVALGVQAHYSIMDRHLAEHATITQITKIHQLGPFKRWFAYSFALSSDSPSAIYNDAATETPKYKSKLNNYGYASLFAINRGKPGLKKYYAGWKTLCLLANGNIRYLLLLVLSSIEHHHRTGNNLSTIVGYKAQTEASVSIGLQIFEQMIGVSANGEFLKQLTLSLGRALQIIAQEPFQHAPELSQFEVNISDTTKGINLDIDAKLKDGVDHLVFDRALSNKLGKTQPKKYEYRIHPLFSPLFQISHRKKRKFFLKDADIDLLVKSPRDGIRRLLVNFNSDPNLFEKDPIPNQLSFYFDAA